MLLHSSTPAMARLLYSAPCRTMLMCSLRSRCAPEGCASLQWQVSRGASRQQSRQHWWSRLQWSVARDPSMHHPPLWVASSSTALFSTTTTSTGHSQTTSNGGAAEEDEADHEALVELEVELYRQEGFPVPSKFTPSHWQSLLALPSVNQRKRYLVFLFKNEKKRENQRKKKEGNKELREEKYRQWKENPPQGDGHIEYGLWKNTIFIKILKQSMNLFYNYRVVQAMLYGQPLVVDLGFDEHMTSQERQNCAYQVQMMMAANRKHKDPYNLELHNAPPTLDTMARLERYIPPLYKPEFPVFINHGSYLEKYPREQLVYLTPHCKEELLTYDHNAVYVIGGIVDKSSREPLTLAKAKREGIRMQKLPLDRYLSWRMGHKSLTLNQMMDIMLDIKMTGDWQYAFRHIPTRKLHPPPQSQQAKEEALLQKIRRMDRGYRKY